MKILKIFGIVVGIHLFALILIFANPGCSSTTKPAPSVGGTASDSDVSPIVAAPIAISGESVAVTDPEPTSSAINFHPDTPAAAAPVIDTGVRFSPTRPGTPVASAIIAEPVDDVMPAAPYTVKSGDNLWTIARRNNLTVAQLTAANNISASKHLRPGQKLIIPRNPASVSDKTASTGTVPKLIDPSASAPNNRSGASVFKHVVKSGETLGAIARRYDVRQGDIAVANNISDPARIRPDQVLIIPGWKSPGSTAAQATKSSNVPANPPAPTAQPSPPATLDLLQSQPGPSTPAPVPVIQIEDEPVPAPL